MSGTRVTAWATDAVKRPMMIMRVCFVVIFLSEVIPTLNWIHSNYNKNSREMPDLCREYDMFWDLLRRFKIVMEFLEHSDRWGWRLRVSGHYGWIADQRSEVGPGLFRKVNLRARLP